MIELPGDDYAGNTNPIMSPAMFRKFIKPCIKRLVIAVKEHNPNTKIMLHSDGAITKLLEDMIDLGIDVIHPLEPLLVTDLTAIKEKFGQQVTFLNIKGEANILEKVRECWASLFTPRSIYYRNINKVEHSKVKISVVVQKMIQSEVSGVMFSINPVTTDKDRVVIESVWGLGEMIVQGSVVPDTYVVQKGTFDILSKEISDQSIQLITLRKQGI